MEGVGARLGRSSTRYGPATVFTGPVRKWKKRWMPYTPPNSANGTNHNNNNNHHHHHHQHHHSAASNGGGTNGNNGSHLLLYKWAPITPSQNNNNGNANGNGKSHVDNNDDSKDEVVPEEQLPKRKFKYIPVAVLEEQKNEAAENVEDEARAMETDTDGIEPTSNSDGFDGKPDINDMPAEESQVHENNPLERQDLNESTLDLSLGLKAHDGENDSDSKTDQKRDG